MLSDLKFQLQTSKRVNAARNIVSCQRSWTTRVEQCCFEADNAEADMRDH
jgi:hypothetical protein